MTKSVLLIVIDSFSPATVLPRFIIRSSLAFAPLLLLSTALLAAEIPSSPWPDVTRQVSRLLSEAEKAYEAKDSVRAKDHVSEAYFGVFEERGMEVAIRQPALGAKFPQQKDRIETKFTEIRRLLATQAPSGKVDQELETLKAQIQEAVAMLNQGQGGWSAFVNGLIVIVREGFEAILIITALAAYLLNPGIQTKSGWFIRQAALRCWEVFSRQF